MFMMKNCHYTHWCLLTIIIVYGTCGYAQICGAAGSLEHNGTMSIVRPNNTYLFLNSTVPCNGTVYIWEFCYLPLLTNPVTFYPSIWRPIDINTYTLININRITYTATSGNQCINHTVSDDEQFGVLSGDIIGLYSNANSQLVSYRFTSVMSYIYSNSNQSGTVGITGRSTTDEIIAIKAYITIPVAVNTSTVIVPTLTLNTNVMASTSISAEINITSSRTAITLRTSVLLETTNVLNTNGGRSTVVTISVTANTHGMSNTIAPSVSTNGVNRDNSTMIVNEPTSRISDIIITSTHEINSTVVINVPNQENENSGSTSDIGVIVGVTLGTIVFIAVMIIIIIFIVIKRNKRAKNYQFSRQIPTTVNDAVIYHNKQLQESVEHDGSNAYEITTIKCGNSGVSSAQSYLTPRNMRCVAQQSISSSDTRNAQSYISPIATEYAHPYVYSSSTGYEYPKSLDKIYADPGNKKETIFNWLEENKVCNFNSSDIKVCEKIGSGQFGVVHLGLWSNGSTDAVQVAVKTLNSQCSELDRVKFLREAAIMGQFVHNNVVQLHGVVTEEENMMIVLEYMPKGDLKKYLKLNKERFSSDKLPCACAEMLLKFCRQIAAGMNYLANKQFVHRDLAARNVLVSNDDVCKIADFGMARDVVDDTFYTASGGKVPVKWTALEAVLYNKYSIMSDVWSFGCVMYEVWSLGHSPFEKVHVKEYLKHIKSGRRLPPPPGCSRALYELMMQCWHPDAMERPKPTMILNRLNELDVTQLHLEDEELTKLGDPLTASEQLYTDLQDLYIINNDYLVISPQCA